MGKAKAKKAKGQAKKTNGISVKRDGVERARYTRKLPVNIDDAAVAVKARELAKVIHDRDRVLEERSLALAEFRSKVRFLGERLDELANSVEDHSELRDVSCVERLVVETNEAQVVRLDTGDIVETRAAEAKDRQEALDFDAPARAVPNELWATAKADALAHHFADGAKESACGVPYVGAPELTPAGSNAPTCKDCSAERTAIGAALAKKGTAAARRKRGGKTTVVASADAE